VENARSKKKKKKRRIIEQIIMRIRKDLVIQKKGERGGWWKGLSMARVA